MGMRRLRSGDAAQAASRDNVRNLHQGLDAFNRRDRDALLAICDPECENLPPREWPENAPIRGAAAIWDYVEAVKTWEDGSFEWGELIDEGTDKIVVNQRRETPGKASGMGVGGATRSYSLSATGKVVCSESFATRAEALEAAGDPHPSFTRLTCASTTGS